MFETIINVCESEHTCKKICLTSLINWRTINNGLLLFLLQWILVSKFDRLISKNILLLNGRLLYKRVCIRNSSRINVTWIHSYCLRLLVADVTCRWLSLRDHHRLVGYDGRVIYCTGCETCRHCQSPLSSLSSSDNASENDDYQNNDRHDDVNYRET